MTAIDTVPAPVPAVSAPLAVLSALLKARRKFAAVTKDKKNDHYRSTFASLAVVLDAVQDALTESGLILMQPFASDGRTHTLRTQLWHAETGQMLETVQVLEPARTDSHALASCLTYWRRQAVKSLLCLAEEDDQTDDDGNLGAGKGLPDPVARRMEAKAAPRRAAPKATAEAPAAQESRGNGESQEAPEPTVENNTVTICAKIAEMVDIKEMQAFLSKVVPTLSTADKKIVRDAYDERFTFLSDSPL